ncbi:unnamed protein product, partial [Prorocentrum cordatum]
PFRLSQPACSIRQTAGRSCAMPPKAKSKHKISALAKAVKTQRHVTPGPTDLNSVALDIRKAAVVPEFTLNGQVLEAGKRAPTTSDVKTVLASESQINVDRRIRNAAVPIGQAIADDAEVSEVLTLDAFRVTRDDRLLMPRRPAWSFEVSSGRLHHREVEGFKRWLADIHELISEGGAATPPLTSRTCRFGGNCGERWRDATWSLWWWTQGIRCCIYLLLWSTT